MTENLYLSVIIPAYNEENRITKTLEAILGYLQKQDCAWEVLVISDGSKDNTAGAVNNFQQQNSGANIRMINNKENRGKGAVVSQGMLSAKGKIRLFTDADNSTAVDHFDKMKPYFEQGYRVVIGSRDPKDAKGAKQAVEQVWHKRLLGNMGNLVIQILAVPGIWDTQCGFKAFEKEAAEKIFSQTTINRWGFDFEALAIARFLGYKIAKIPLYWVNDPHSNVKFKDYFKTFFEAVKVRFNLIKGVYKK